MTISFGISLRSIFTLLTIDEVPVKAQIFEFDSYSNYSPCLAKMPLKYALFCGIVSMTKPGVFDSLCGLESRRRRKIQIVSP